MTEPVQSWGCEKEHPDHGRRRRDAYLQDDAVVVRSVDRKGRSRPWTRPGNPLPVPDHVTLGSLRIHAVVPHEWTTDLVASFTDRDDDLHIEAWRLSPVRILETHAVVPDVVGELYRLECQRADHPDPSARTLTLLTRDEAHVFVHTIEVSASGGSKLSDSKHRRRAYDLFVSYKSREREFAGKVVERLKAKGIDVWFAPLQDKGKFAREMPDLIDRARHVLLLLSKGSDEDWDQVVTDPQETPYKQAHEIVQALDLKASKSLILCCADTTEATAVREEVKAGNRHIFTRAEAAEKYGSDAGRDGYARRVADYVMGRMRLETLK